MVLTEVFLTFVISSLIGCTLATLKYVYKIKFSSLSCGCCKITRDTDAEENLEKMKIENNITSPRSDDVMNTARTNDRFLKV